MVLGCRRGTACNASNFHGSSAGSTTQKVSLSAGYVGAVIRDVLCSVTRVRSMSVNGDIQNPCRINNLLQLPACVARSLSFTHDNALCQNGYGDAWKRHKSLIKKPL